jgi:methionyl-tRNA formyltransferase
MLDFYGPYDFVRVGSKYASYKILGMLNGRLGTGRSYNLAQLCGKYGIRVLRSRNINSGETLEELRKISPDLIISVAAPAIFKEELIRIPKYGCINIHNGKLPRYRGMLPNFWQLYHNEERVGITIHEINPGIDDGRIILQKEVDVETSETLDSLIRRTKKLGAHYMIEAIDLIKSGSVKYIENNPAEASYFSFPKREDVRKFKAMGKRLL